MGKNEKECSICYCEFQTDEEVTPLPCDLRHVYHTECLVAWFKNQSVCPICRQENTPQQMKEFRNNVDRLLQERILKQLEEDEANAAQADEESGRRPTD